MVRRCYTGPQPSADVGLLAMINLRNIEAFLAVSDTGSFTAAARRLHKTQSAISQAVRQLEEELGVILVNRAARQLELTAAGALLRNRGGQLIEDVQSIASLVRSQSRTRLRELRFGMVDSFASAVGPALIGGLLDEATNLSLWSDLTPMLGEALLQKRVDIVVANDAFVDESRLTRHELLREPFVLLLPADIPWDPVAPDLPLLARSYPMIRYQPLSHLGASIDAQCHRLDVRPARRVSVDSTEKLIAMVAAGIGWSSSTPISLLRAPAHCRGIRVVPFPGEAFERRLYMLSRHGELDDLVDRLAGNARRALEGVITNELAPRMPEWSARVRIVGRTESPLVAPNPSFELMTVPQSD
jgi:DNA-binding transcriptional LysR family regulator